MKSIYKGALITTLAVATYAYALHAGTVSPTNFLAVTKWLPLYISPIWIIAGGVEVSNKFSKKKK